MKKRLIILGASGVIGTALNRFALEAGHNVIATAKKRFSTDLIQFDLERDKISKIVPDLNSNDVVYILAAHTSQQLIDKNPEAARGLNVDATIRISKEAQDFSAHIIFMSTDQVFDGKLGGYTEESITNPLNDYGCMKVEVEKWLLKSINGFTIARTGWNVPQDTTSSCPIIDIHSQMKNRTASLATDNVISLTDVNDTARSLVLLAEMDSPPKICHIVSGRGISRTQIGDQIKRSSQNANTLNYAQIKFQELPIAKKRPAAAWMSNKFIKRMGHSFTDPNDVIHQKMNLIET